MAEFISEEAVEGYLAEAGLVPIDQVTTEQMKSTVETLETESQ